MSENAKKADPKDKNAKDAKAAAPAGASKLGPVALIAMTVLNTGVSSAVLAVTLLKPPPAPAPAGPAGEHGKEAAAGEAGKEGAEGEHGTEEPPKPTHFMMKLEDFTVQLRNPEVDRYARISFDLELAKETDKDFVTAYVPQVRSAIISYMSDLAYEELRGSQGLERLKIELYERIDKIVPDKKVKGVFITNFVSQ